MRGQRSVAVLVALLLAVLPLAGGRTPASAGTWSGSTADDGTGHTISVEGNSTDTHNPDGTTTSTSQSTTTVKDNATGQVVTVIKRSRTIAKTAPPGPKTVRAASVDETTSYTTGGAYSVAHDEQAVWPVAGGRTQSSREHLTQQYGPDSGGHPVLKGQQKVVVQSDGSKRTIVHQVWDPQTNQWQAGDQLATPLQTSKTPQVYLPDHVAATCPAGGTVETPPQTAPAGTVVATAPKGQPYEFLVDPTGRFALPPDFLTPGAWKLTVKDQAGATIANRTMQVDPAPAATAPSAPAITQAPPVLLGGGIGRLSLLGGCRFDYQLGPSFSLNTPKFDYTLHPLSWSDSALAFRVPTDIMPGRGAFLLGNGFGQWSAPMPTNPVRLDLTWGSDLKLGRPFDLKFELIGLAKGIAAPPVTITVKPWGTGAFPGGNPQSTVTFTDGVGHLPFVVQRQGPFGVGVTGLSSSTGLSGPFVPFRDLAVGPGGAAAGAQLPPCLSPADDDLHPVPVVTTPPGADGRCALTSPGPGYTQVTAKASDSYALTLQQPDNTGSGWGVNFKASRYPGVSVITVVWTNPQTRQTQTQYVVVGSGAVIDSAKSLSLDWEDVGDAEDDYYDMGYDFVGWGARIGDHFMEFSAHDWTDFSGTTHVDVRVIESDRGANPFGPLYPSTGPMPVTPQGPATGAPRPAQPSQQPAGPPHDDHGGGGE